MLDMQIELFNIAKVQRDMALLPKKFQTVVMRAMCRAGATVVKKYYKDYLKANNNRTGSMAKAVTVKVKAYKGVVVGMAGIRKDFEAQDRRGKRVVPAKYNHLVELGRRAFNRVWFNKKKNQRFRDGKTRYIKYAPGKYPLKFSIAEAQAAVAIKMQEVFKKQVETQMDKAYPAGVDNGG